jgi:outer membrane protein OmpA-like peptidoglycan-associated protein
LKWLLAFALVTSSARADAWALRGSAAAGLVISEDQVARYHYDEISELFALQAERVLIGPLAARAGLTLGLFPTSEHGAGGILAGAIGPVLAHEGARMRSYLGLAFGPTWTGDFVRPFLSIDAGLDMPISQRVSLGPVVGYGQVFQRNGPGYSSDARFISFGLSCRGRFVREVSPPARVVQQAPKEEPPSVRAEPATPVDVTALIEQALPAQRVELLAPILFAFDSDRLDEQAVAMLYEVKRVLDARVGTGVEVRGYADARGTSEHNRELSRRRAERVCAWLVEHAIASERLSVAAEGVSDPRDGDSQERRVVFRITEESR